jgi:hypothetical protein
MATPRKDFRCPPELWDEAAAKAARLEYRGGVSAVLRDLLRRWLDEPERPTVTTP